MSDATPDPSRCPRCGVVNQCGMAAGSSECWCFGVAVSKEALERLPDAAQGKACLCAKCAAGAGPVAGEAGSRAGSGTPA